jgi:ankyrin repeat protein
MSRANWNAPPASSFNVPNRTVPTQVDPHVWALAFGGVSQIPPHSAIHRTAPARATQLRDRLMEQLLQAIKKVDLEGFEVACTEFLNQGFDLDTRAADGRLPLVTAVRYGTLEMVKRLIARGAGIETKDGWGRTALTAGLINDFKNDDTIYNFIETMLPNDKAAEMKCEALYEASRQGYVNAVDRLLRKGVPLTYRNDRGMNAAHIAAERGRWEVLERIKRHDRRFHEMRDTHRSTPLHHAVANRQIETIEFLLRDLGRLRLDTINLSRQNNDGQTALHLAVQAGCEAAVELIADELTVLIPDNAKKLPLHYALEKGSLTMIARLLAHGDPKSQIRFDVYRNSPFDIAQRNQQHDVLHLFAEQERLYDQKPHKELVFVGALRPEPPAPGAARETE